MTAVTYVAKREIQRVSLSVVSADISVAAADDSFNTAGVVDFSGMSSGEWIYVSGLTDASETNNGWHQLEADSTSTKLDTSSALTDEPAGDSVSIVGYLHGYGQEYDLDLSVAAMNRKYSVPQTVNTPIDGASESLIKREQIEWSLTLAPTHKDNLGPIREFISSCVGRETFTFDPYGSVASSDDPVSAELIVDSYTESRVSGTSYFNVSFSLRVL